MTRRALAKTVDMQEKSLYMLEEGINTPRAETREKLEGALGWRRGSMSDVLAGRATTFEEMLEPEPGTFASIEGQLGDSQVLGEALMRAAEDAVQRIAVLEEDYSAVLEDRRELRQRVRWLEGEVDRLTGRVKVLQAGQYGLAADSSPNMGARLRDMQDAEGEA